MQIFATIQAQHDIQHLLFVFAELKRVSCFLNDPLVSKRTKFDHLLRGMFFLEQEVTRLSSLHPDLDRRRSNHAQVFESEQLYRRGCEYFYGTNGYGERGEDLSKTLRLSLLRSSADLGHADAQY
jgi:hypothetical protein